MGLGRSQIKRLADILFVMESELMTSRDYYSNVPD